MPFYVLIIWGPHPRQSLEAINLNDVHLQGANAPVPVGPSLPDCYCVTSLEQAMMLVRAINYQFAGVNAFVWDLPGPMSSCNR